MMSTPASVGADESVRFQWIVRGLAQPAGVQTGLFPGFTCVADELALEFEECLNRFTSSNRMSTLDERQRKLVEELDQQLTAMSGPAHEELWMDEALETAPEWTEVRARAKRLIDAMQWSHDPPPASRYVYVGPDA
jgi:hypothetical protein